MFKIITTLMLGLMVSVSAMAITVTVDPAPTDGSLITSIPTGMNCGTTNAEVCTINTAATKRLSKADDFSVELISSDPNSSWVVNVDGCTTTSGSRCTIIRTDANASVTVDDAPGTSVDPTPTPTPPPSAAANIPTLSVWGLIFLSSIIALFGFGAKRKD